MNASSNSMNRKILLFGGTFAPIHVGHLILAEWAWEQYDFEEVVFLPAGDPPHKEGEWDADFRLELVKRATADNPHFRVDDFEMVHSGPSYTLMTLEHYLEEDPEREIYFLMGEDSLRDFHKWHAYEKLLHMAHFLVARRDRDEAADAIMKSYVAKGAKMEYLDSAYLDISSTMIRSRLASGESIRYLVPESIRGLLEEHK